jgi:hypothetical protein
MTRYDTRCRNRGRKVRLWDWLQASVPWEFRSGHMPRQQHRSIATWDDSVDLVMPFFFIFSSYVQVWLSQSFTFAPLSWAFWQFWAFHAGCYDMTIPIGCSLMPFFWREEHGFCVMTTSPSIQFHPTTKETSRCHVAGMCCESPLSWSGEWSTSSLSYLGFRDNLKLFNRKT